MTRIAPLVLLSFLTVLSAAPRTPPEALFFDVPGLQQRIRLNPPLVTVSGRYRLELIEVDRLRSDSETQVRLVLVCPGESDLAVLGDVYALDEHGQELVPRTWQVLAQGGDSWLTITFGAAAGKRLAVFSATVGPRPRTEERAVPLSLDKLGQAVMLPDERTAICPALLRLETARLPIAAEPPPLYRGLESTRQSDQEPPPPTAGQPYLSLRLYVLAPPENSASWRLINLRLPGVANGDDWRYARYPWRPDWGGWLGVKGRDLEADQAAGGGPAQGVVVAGVVPEGPAAAAGLRVGDLLVAVDGRPVRDAYGLSELVRTRPGDGTIACEVQRDGRRVSLTVHLGRRELWPELDDTEFTQAWGLLTAVAAAEAAGDLLSIWDWQTRFPLPAAEAPANVELVFQRTASAAPTTFLFRRVPLQTDN